MPEDKPPGPVGPGTQLPKDDNEDLVTAEEVGRMFSVSAETARRWRRMNKFAPEDVVRLPSGRYLYRRSGIRQTAGLPPLARGPQP